MGLYMDFYMPHFYFVLHHKFQLRLGIFYFFFKLFRVMFKALDFKYYLELSKQQLQLLQLYNTRIQGYTYIICVDESLI